LARPLHQLSDADRVDVVVTNPPFGGEEERQIQQNFPEETQTTDTALLFLQVIERLLRPGGRCGIVLPNSVLYQAGVAARIKQRLFAACDVHTIVRLPPGVFAPSTDIPTNIVFFDHGRPTTETWYYEVPLPADRRQYTKTRPLQRAAFDDCIEWWGGGEREGRVESNHAWRVAATDVASRMFNLDYRNPRPPGITPDRPPEDIVADLVRSEHRLASLVGELTVLFAEDRR
jgi:type I restriction enzyme M protein